MTSIDPIQPGPHPGAAPPPEHAMLAIRTARPSQAMWLVAFSLINYLVFVVIHIVLARNLTEQGFDDYNLAISILTILSTFAPLGLEKLALKILPSLYERRDWVRSRGFLWFSIRTIVSIGLAAFVLFAVGLELTLHFRGRGYHIPILVLTAFLPVICLFLFLLEVCTAYGYRISSIAVYRIALPLLLLAVNLCLLALPVEFTGRNVAIGYGFAWTLALCLMLLVLKRALPADVLPATPQIDRRTWLSQSIPMLTFSLLLTVQTHAGVIVLGLIDADETMVSEYAVCLQIGTFIVIVATATNRFYLPMLAVLIERGSYDELLQRSRARLKLIGTMAAVYMAGIVLYGRQLLGFYGAEFEAAYPALIVVAAGASIGTLFSLAPYFLQYLRLHELTLRWTALAVGIGVAGSVPLAYWWGAFGAALAYAVPLAALHLSLRLQIQKLPRD